MCDVMDVVGPFIILQLWAQAQYILSSVLGFWCMHFSVLANTNILILH